MKMLKESQVQKEICDYLDTLKNCWYFKSHGNRYQKTGLPDLIGVYNGRFFGIEVKRPGGLPTDIQLFRLEQIKKAGGLGGVADSLVKAKAILEE